MNEFLQSLPVVARSPLALIGLLAIIFGGLGLQAMRRYSQLLQYLEKLPPEGRAEALRDSLGHLPAPARLNPKDWLRAQRQRYIFQSVLAIIGLAAVVAAFLTTGNPSNVQISKIRGEEKQRHSETITYLKGIDEKINGLQNVLSPVHEEQTPHGTKSARTKLGTYAQAGLDIGRAKALIAEGIKLTSENKLVQARAALSAAEQEAESPDTRFLVYRAQGSNEYAAGNFRLAVQKYERAKSLYPSNVMLLAELADAQLATGNSTAATTNLQTAAKEMYRQHSSPVVQATVLNNLSAVYYSTGRYPEAGALLSQAIAIRTRELGEKHMDTLTSRFNKGVLLYYQKRLEDSETVIKDVLSDANRYHGKSSAIVADLKDRLGSIRLEQGEFKGAEKLFKDAKTINIATRGQEHPNTLAVEANLGEVARMTGRYQEAVQRFERLIPIEKRVLGDSHPDVGTTYNNLAICYRRLGREKEAERAYESAFSIRRASLGADSDQTMQVLMNLAFLHYKEKRGEQALTELLSALPVFERCLPQPSVELANTYAIIGMIHLDNKEKHLAVNYLSKGRNVYRSLGIPSQVMWLEGLLQKASKLA